MEVAAAPRDARVFWMERALWVFVLVAAALLSFGRGYRGAYDFRHFYLDAAYVWQHGGLNPSLDPSDPKGNRQLPFYLPVVPLVISPVAAGGMQAGAAIWAALQVGALGYVLYRLRSWTRAGREPHHASLTWSLLVLLSLPAIYEAVRFNQVTWFTLALLLAAQHALERGRDLRAGAWFAAAAVLKLLPALFGVWLLLKRRWAAALAMAVASLLIAFIPPIILFGPQKAWQYHQEWWDYNVTHGGSRRFLTIEEWGPHSEHFVDRRNQSIATVCARLFWPDSHVRAAWQPLSLTLEQTLLLANGITITLFLVLLLSTRGRLTAGDVRVGDGGLWRLRGEFAVFGIAIQVLAPLSRLYYLAWTMPALALLVWYATPANPRLLTRAILAGRLGVLFWFLGMAAWPWRIFREVGLHQVMLIGMAACVLVAIRRSETAGAMTENTDESVTHTVDSGVVA